MCYRVDTPCTLPGAQNPQFQHRLSYAKNRRRVSLPLPRYADPTPLLSSPLPSFPPSQPLSILTPQPPNKPPPRTLTAQQSRNQDMLHTTTFPTPYNSLKTSTPIHQTAKPQKHTKSTFEGSLITVKIQYRDSFTGSGYSLMLRG
jgi:hypothetical protein